MKTERNKMFRAGGVWVVTLRCKCGNTVRARIKRTDPEDLKRGIEEKGWKMDDRRGTHMVFATCPDCIRKERHA